MAVKIVHVILKPAFLCSGFLKLDIPTNNSKSIFDTSLKVLYIIYAEWNKRNTGPLSLLLIMKVKYCLQRFSL